MRLKEGDDAATAASALADHDGFIIADLPADELLKVADVLRDRRTVLFDAGAIDDRLREQELPRQCRPCRADPPRCSRMRSPNISYGNNGSAGCWWSARTTT